MIDPTDPAAIAAALIACPSVTPRDAGAQAVLTALLAPLGFEITPLRFNQTENFFARRGTAGPHLCFAGHTDVVPPGAATWQHPPFAAQTENGILYGRGAVDMKGGIAAFTAAAARAIAARSAPPSLSFLITGDEEGEATDGTIRVVEWMRDHSHIPDFALVGEPTSVAALGDTLKIGRRGSLNATLTVHGTQGHAAYPGRADNPVHRLLAALHALATHPLDDGTGVFEPSRLQITSIDVGNPATNVIPARAEARLNIRFNDRHSAASLGAWLHGVIAAHAPSYDLALHASAAPFVTSPGPVVDLLCQVIAQETGRTPTRDTGGGTSDARFLAPHCPVAEFGPVGASMHKADEHVRLDDLATLTRIYERFIAAFAEAAWHRA